MFQDLREFIDLVDKSGDLRRVSGADPHLEMGALVWVAGESPACPMLLFDNIKGYPGCRAVTNWLNAPRRLALAAGLPTDVRGVDFVRAWKERVLFGKGPPPVLVKNAAFEENSISGKDINIKVFPSILWHEKDGGKYFGAGAITVIRDPDSGYINYGIYRMQSHKDKTKVVIHPEPSNDFSVIRRRYWARGQNCPVAVCDGVDPALWLAGVFFSPLGQSEYEVASSLRGEPVRVVISDLTGLPVPANSEIVIEGEIPPPEKETVIEGPFGEFTGYYSDKTPEPVILIKRIMHRNDPIMIQTPPMRPSPGLNQFGVNWRAALIWSDLEKAGMWGIKGVWQHGISSVVISMKQHYPGHAKQVGLAVASSRNASMVRFIILVDDDIDPANLSEVLWATTTRCEPEEIDIVRNANVPSFDTRIPPEKRVKGNFTGSRAIIDACRPYHWRNEFPVVNDVSAELKAKTLRKWGKLLNL